jgi:hypothetical protein
MRDPPDRALTHTEAAEALGVTPQRISQMLRSGALSGPEMRSGRAPKNVGRVWQHAIDREISDRQAGNRGRRHESGSVVEDSRRSHSRHDAAAWEAARTMKIALDEARQALSDRRQERQRLVDVLKEAAAKIERGLEEEGALDRIAEAYSDALTQVLIPDQP